MDFIPWARVGRGLLVIPDRGPARIEPPVAGTPCQHPSPVFTGYGFPAHPERYVLICPNDLAILGDPIIRERGS